jgi:hypothetical protein
MPSVGGTAEDLKMEATQIAQNIVNSFVSCFYFNDEQTGKECDDPSYYLVQRGYAFAGEVVSNISKEDANSRAIQIADSRTICISPDIVDGAGCASTEILAGGSTAGTEPDHIAAISISYDKSGCVFTPTISLTTPLTMTPINTFEVQLCSPTGATRTVYVVGLDGDYSDQSLKIPIKYDTPP